MRPVLRSTTGRERQCIECEFTLKVFAASDSIVSALLNSNHLDRPYRQVSRQYKYTSLSSRLTRVSLPIESDVLGAKLIGVRIYTEFICQLCCTVNSSVFWLVEKILFFFILTALAICMHRVIGYNNIRKCWIEFLMN